MRCSAALLVVCALASAVCAQDPASQANQRNQAYGDELEQYFRDYLVTQYPGRAAKAWHRSYESQPAFLKSVEPNRARYRAIFSPPDLKPSGAVQHKVRPDVPGVRAEWLTIPLGLIKAEALLVIPENAKWPVPLVIAQHGIDSCPERVFGIGDDGNHYHDYGHALVNEGFAVLAPLNLSKVPNRNRIERLAKLAGTSLPGLEFRRMQVLLDEVLKDKRIDKDRVGMWGISLGGMATMFWMPLEPRIQCGIVTAWFNQRRNKMAIPDPRYSCFLETAEEHAFFKGWLTEFTDSDVASLICPRPLLVQTGKNDRIAWWPQVIEEFEASKDHYKRLGIADRIEMDLHEGGHEIRVESGVPFLKKWLSK
jgi:dienelactone hydrolase